VPTYFPGQGGPQQQPPAPLAGGTRFPGSEPEPAPPAGPPPETSRTPGILDRLVSGMTFGLSDEASTLGGAVGRQLRGRDETFGQSWDAARQRVLAEQQAGQQATGGLGTAAELAGGFLAPVPGAGGATSLAGSMARGAGSAALGGALQGAGSGEGVGDRLQRAAIGGGVGAAIGGVAAPAVELGWKAISARMPSAARGSARGLLERALGHDQTTPADAAAAIAAANAAGHTGVSVPLVAGEGVRGLAEDVVNSPNPAQTTLKSSIQARQMDQGQRLTDEATRLGGFTGQTYQTTLADILARRQAQAAPAFAKAFQFDTAASPDAVAAFDELMQTGAGPKAFNRARELAQNLQPGFKPPKLSDLYDDQGRLTAVPTMEFMHYLKMGVDDLYSSAARGDSGMGRTMARSIATVGDRFRSALGQANPDYATALHGYAGESAMKDALEAGREAWARPADEFHQAYNGMPTAAEKEMFRLGGLSRMTGDLAKRRQGPTADIAANLSLVPDVRSKMGVVISDPASQQAWQRLLELEARQSQLAARTGGSPTSRRMEQSAEVGGDALIGQATQAAVGRGGTTVPDLILNLMRPVGRGLDAYAKSERRGALGGMLGLTDREAIAMLQRMAVNPSPPPWLSSALSPRVVSAGAAGYGPPQPPSAGPPAPPWYPPGGRR
jgi:hypothetical protein